MPTLRSFLKKFETPKQRILRLSAEGKADKIRTLLDTRGLALAGVRDKQGRTPLFLAALNGHTEAMRVLMAAGADPSATDATGQTPLQTLLAIPEPTDEQRRALGFMGILARVEPIDPSGIANPSVKKTLERRFYPRVRTSQQAAEVVGRNVEVVIPGNKAEGTPDKTIGLPRDVQALITRFGGKTRSRKMRRRQTRRRR